jgi:hypothetical protein
LKGLHERFWEEPNIYFAQYDVLVCTTVIGAGFSIDSQFVCFHAFFFVGGLTFEEELLPRLPSGVLTFEEQEERQLIARLRLAEAQAPATDRQLFRRLGDPQAFVVV